MDNEAPTSGDGDAGTSDPIARLENFLAAQSGDTNQDEGESHNPEKAASTPDDPTGDAQGKDPEPQFTTAHLAQFLGLEESQVDVDADGQPVFKTKIDGKDGAAKFQDFLKTYQLQEHAETKSRKAAEREQAAERRLQEAEQTIQARHQQIDQSLQSVQALAAVAHEELSREYNSINWNDLRATDPGRAALLEVEFNKRSGRLQNVLGDINNRRAFAAQQAEAQRRANDEQSAQTQGRRLLELIPEWKDPQVAEKERVELLNWISRSGFDPAELDLGKATQVKLLRKAWQHETLQASKPETEQKLRAAPKLVKPGAAAQAGDTSNAGQLKNLKQIARSSGGNSTKAVAAWLMATGKA
jgi:hypothetical protein